MESSVPDAATSCDDPHDFATSEHGCAYDCAYVCEHGAGDDDDCADHDLDHAWEHDRLHTDDCDHVWEHTGCGDAKLAPHPVHAHLVHAHPGAGLDAGADAESGADSGADSCTDSGAGSDAVIAISTQGAGYSAASSGTHAQRVDHAGLAQGDGTASWAAPATKYNYYINHADAVGDGNEAAGEGLRRESCTGGGQSKCHHRRRACLRRRRHRLQRQVGELVG
mmetsp:Transcript_38604/g.124051  ORF Transcript_38604/g.124051 Transcript_38604/m.124051 type:complete len:223 (-) Transcript_38604:1289-1957(-)